MAPASEAMNLALAHRDQFGVIRIVEDPMNDLAVARAAGVRAASAPLVFIGETHSFPQPRLTEIIVEAMTSADWSVVVPAICNANPQGALSWSGYILDYGQWADGLPAGEIADAPVYNAAYKTGTLLALGSRLSSALGQSDELALTLRAGGHRTRFEPDARIDHANVIRLRHWIMNRLLAGILIGANRSRKWPLTRRAAYVGGSFLIPLVLLRRLMPGIREVARGNRLPVGTLPAVVVALILRAGGEALGYAGLFSGCASRGMHRYEVHKLKYAGPLGA